MNLNCQPGDLDVVIDDEPGCEANIGRFVTVLEAKTFSDSNQPWWSIRPIDGQPWTFIDLIEGGKWVEVVQHIGRTYIEDRCLSPVRGGKTTSTVQAGTSCPMTTNH